MKILVTGASGYIGNKLVHALAAQGNAVHAFIRSSSAHPLLQHPNIKIFHGDVMNEESLENAMKGCEQVYHLAALVKLWEKDSDMFYRVNTTGTVNVLKLALKLNVRKLVYTSTCGVWSPANNYVFSENDPNISSFNNDYDLSKFLAEKTVRDYAFKGLFTVIVNPPRVYGPGQFRFSSGVNRFVCQLLNNRVSPLPWRMDTKANYTFIDDVVKGHILAMEKGLGGERYILGGENISYTKFVKTVTQIGGRKNFLVRIHPAVMKTVGWIEMMRSKMNGHEPWITPGMVARFGIDKMLDSSKAQKQLGYSITPFEKGIRITIDHLKTHHHVRN
jgi:nucleoside-diphosphate-sugar epimerase